MSKKNMVGIIIPAYNAHKTLSRTLASLTIQVNINIAKIYIINDCSKKNYKSEINMFRNKLDIVELKTPKNLGPGVARQYGINNSNGKYIIFLDADDQFYNPYSLNLLYNTINDEDLDLVYGKEYVEKEGIDYYNHGSLHGKIYKRDFIEKNNIKFNNTKYSEDTSFNQIVKHTSDKIKKLDYITYLYINNDESLTQKNNKENLLLMYIYNMIWVCLELKRKKVDKNKIVNVLIFTYIKIFKEITDNSNDNYSDIFNKCYRLECLYETYITADDQEKEINTICEMFECNSKNAIFIYNDFNLFRRKFKVK